MSSWFREITEILNEAEKSDPCWDGYEMRGMKKKGKKTVPNCVKLDESDNVKEKIKNELVNLLKLHCNTVDYAEVDDTADAIIKLFK